MLLAFPPPLSYDYQQLTISEIHEIREEPIPELVVRLFEESGLSDFAKATAFDVAHCESTLRQYDEKGDLLRGRINDRDVGIFQINEDYHGKEADRLGFDIHEPVGNIRYAIYLIKRQGFVPWIWSRDCWAQ